VHVHPNVQSRESYHKREQSGDRSAQDKPSSYAGFFDLLGDLADCTSLKVVNLATDLGELSRELYSQKSE
jgi:hypothetical protein